MGRCVPGQERTKDGEDGRERKLTQARSMGLKRIDLLAELIDDYTHAEWLVV